MPTGNELRAYYERKAKTLDELALTYENQNRYKRFFYRARSNAVLDALAPIRAGSRVLDVGAGSGFYGRQISAAGAHAVLIDISLTGLDRARATGANAVGYVCCDAANLPFASRTFDKVLCTEVLEHLPDATQALCETARVLRQDGEMVATTPSRRSPMNVAYGIKRRVRRYTFNEHLTEYTSSEFRRLLECMYRIDRVAYANFLVPYPFDEFFINVQSPRLVAMLQWLEDHLANTPILRQLGWTMIANCKSKET